MAESADARAPDRRSTEGRLSSELRRNAGLVAAVFGLLGTVVGGGITYLTNKSLQDRQTAEQSAQRRVATEGAAKLAISRYDQFLQDLQQMESDHILVVPSQLPPPADAGNQAAIVVDVSEANLLALARADDDIQTIRGFLRAQTGDVVSSDLLSVLRQDTPDIKQAIVILEPLGRL